MTEQLYKFEPPRPKVSGFSKTVPDDRRDGMISILIFGMIRNSLGRSGDEMSQGMAGIFAGSVSSGISGDEERIGRFKILEISLMHN